MNRWFFWVLAEGLGGAGGCCGLRTEILTEEARKIVGSGPTSLTDSLGNRVGGDGEESAAEVASPDSRQRAI